MLKPPTKKPPLEIYFIYLGNKKLLLYFEDMLYFLQNAFQLIILSLGSFTLHFGLKYEMIYQLEAIEYLFVSFQLDMFRAYTPIFRSNGCYNYFTYFSLQGKIPVVTIVWVVSRFRLKAPPGISSSCISPLTSSGQRSRASWASQSQKLATLSPQPGGKPRKFIRTRGGIWENK